MLGRGSVANERNETCRLLTADDRRIRSVLRSSPRGRQNLDDSPRLITLAKRFRQLPARVTWESTAEDEHIENSALDLFTCVLERLRGHNIKTMMFQKQPTGTV